MPWGPEDDAAMRDDAILQWAKRAPQRPGSYDYPASSEDQAYYASQLEVWAAQRPNSDPGWEQR